MLPFIFCGTTSNGRSRKISGETMRQLFVLSMFLVLSFSAMADVKLKVEPARVLGLWSFAQDISEIGKHRSEIISNLFKKSKFANDPKFQETLGEFRKIRESQFKQSYIFQGYPESRGEMGWDVDRHFIYQASQSKTLKEFRSRTAQVISPADQFRLFQTLGKIEPVYEELIWRPYAPRLKQYGNRLMETWNSGKLSDLYSKVIKFYRAEWSANPVFTVHMMPIPAAKGRTSATVIDDAIILESLLDEKDLPGRVGVIFHELCHSAYEAQTLEFQQQLDSWFSVNGSRYSLLAKDLMNEGLATALGNGLAYRRITGREDESEWYNVEEIDQGAKAASELVRSYALVGKSMDRNFVDQWVSMYEKRFPNAFNLTSIRIRESILLTDGKVMKSEVARAELKRFFRIDSLYSSSLITDEESFKALRDGGKTASLILVISQPELRQLKKLTDKVAGLSEATAAIEKAGPSRVVSFSHENRMFLIFKVETIDEFVGLVKKLKDLKEIPPKPTVVAEI